MAKNTQPKRSRQTLEDIANLAPDERPTEVEHSLEQFLAETFGEDAPSTDPNGLPSLGWLKSKFKSKSAAIRYLHHEKKATPSQIAKLLSVKYQHVRNVITTPLKRGPNESYIPDSAEESDASPEHQQASE